jgi:AcrR family transcriptional regulator
MEHASPARARWFVAGQQLLVEGGARSIKLIPLAEAAGLTTGSFYHHFRSMPAFLAELARSYATDHLAEGLDQASSGDPVARLRLLDRIVNADDARPLDQAMRDWAGSNRSAAAAVEEADAAALRFIEQAFLDMGTTRADARARALVLYSALTSRAKAPWSGPASTFDAALKLLIPST